MYGNKVGFIIPTLGVVTLSAGLSRVLEVCRKDRFDENQSVSVKDLEKTITYLPVWRRGGEVIVVVDDLGMEGGGCDTGGVVGDHPQGNTLQVVDLLDQGEYFEVEFSDEPRNTRFELTFCKFNQHS